MRATIEHGVFIHDNQSIPVTVSIGLVAYDPRKDDFTEAKMLIAAADECLYQAKQQGRNRVCFPDSTTAS